VESVYFEIADFYSFSWSFDGNFVEFSVAKEADFLSIGVKFGIEAAFFRVCEQSCFA